MSIHRNGHTTRATSKKAPKYANTLPLRTGLRARAGAEVSPRRPAMSAAAMAAPSVLVNGASVDREVDDGDHRHQGEDDHRQRRGHPDVAATESKLVRPHRQRHRGVVR